MPKDKRKPETIIRDLRGQLNRAQKANQVYRLKLLEEARAHQATIRERDVLRRALQVLEKSVGIEPEAWR